jgi:phosphatidylserine/phosphatidylglycerophosphate/cardiolipin synthase-like enzyme
MASRPSVTARHSPRRAPLLIALAALALAALLLSGRLSPASLLTALGVDPAAVGMAGPPRPAATTVDGAIAVFFTTPELVYPDVPRGRIAPAAERALLADIAAARSSIDLASFEYNLDSLATALAQAQARGVRVRLALDRESLINPVMARWAGSVEDAGVTVSWQEGDGFLHSKFVIIDRRVVWTGSWNPTVNDTYRNNNNLLRIRAPELVANYSAEFAQMAAGTFGGGKVRQTPNSLVQLGATRVENYFSPHEQVRTRIIALIGQAEQHIEVLAFAFTDDAIGAALAERHAAGVPVRVVFEARNAMGVGSEFAPLRAQGLEVLSDGNCYTMHHKVIIIDGRIVITGSYNFTARAEEVNDENLLIISNPALAAAYQAEFARIYAQAQGPPRCL